MHWKLNNGLKLWWEDTTNWQTPNSAKTSGDPRAPADLCNHSLQYQIGLRLQAAWLLERCSVDRLALPVPLRDPIVTYWYTYLDAFPISNAVLYFSNFRTPHCGHACWTIAMILCNSKTVDCNWVIESCTLGLPSQRLRKNLHSSIKGPPQDPSLRKRVLVNLVGT